VDGQGATRTYLSHVFPLVDATGHGWGLGYIGTDITERKHADLALLQSQKLESLGLMAGGIAHDFNNFLGAMRGYVELANTESSPEQAAPYLGALESLIDKASGLLRQMMAYAGQGKGTVQTLDLNELVGEIAHLLTTSISKKATKVMNLHPQPLLLAADPSQLQQVVMNLVINASEALEEQNGTITLDTGLENLTREAIDACHEGLALQPGPHVMLRVTDDGAGMRPEVLRRIFDPFFTTKFTGRGLGLAAISGIVRGHQGSLRVATEVGKGSSFTLLFPAAKGRAAATPPEPSLLPGPDRGAGLVLVVDDEEPMRTVLAKGLNRAGFHTLQAANGLEALALFQQHRDLIRLVLLDLTMPIMDGEETCRELRRQGAGVPVILCSGFNEAEALDRFGDLGLAGFLQKPFGLGTLVERVERALG